jgi:hypothetical protein
VPHATREVGSFWWKDILRLNNIYRSLSRCIIGNGATACFWEDRWAENILANSFPRLASFSKSSLISVLDTLVATDLDSIFFLPLSEQAEMELAQLQDQLEDYYFDADTTDQWQPLWNGDYTAKKFYRYIYDELEAPPIFHIIWSSKCMSRIKFFTWLVLVDRLNTKMMLTRRHIGQRDDDLCIMCTLVRMRQWTTCSLIALLQISAGES